MSQFSMPGMVGWVDLALFNALFLSMNCRMGTRMAAISNNTGFMLQFLNPDDRSRFSENFELDMEGSGFGCLLAMVVAGLGAVLVMLLPFPWQFASRDMKTNAKQASIDTAQQFIRSVEYFNRAHPSVIVEQLLSATNFLQKELDGASGSIGAAWFEGFDFGNSGKVRHLMERHVDALNKVFDILHQLQIAMATDSFGAIHKSAVEKCGPTAHLVAEKTGVLLLSVTEAACDGYISDSEKQDLMAVSEEVKSAVKQLSLVFDTTRRKLGKPVCKDLLHASHFFFALSAYARIVTEYTDMACNAPPAGLSFSEAVVDGIKSCVTWEREYHGRFAFRYWFALLVCFVFAVRADSFGGACAVTACFMMNERVGADMMAILNVLLAVVVSAVIGGLIYSYSCMTGYGDSIMFVVVAIYLITTLNIAFSGSSFATIGIFMAALAPFQMVKQCPVGGSDDMAAAQGLWVGIRGTMIAMVILSTCEYASIPGEQGRMAVLKFDSALQAIQAAFVELWDDKEPKSCDGVSGLLSEASTYNKGAILEPRGARTPWRFQLMSELIGSTSKLRADILTIRHGLGGHDLITGRCWELLRKVQVEASPRRIEKTGSSAKYSALEAMAEDLRVTLEDSREIAVTLLSHGSGPLDIIHKLHTTEGIDELDGLDAAIANINDFGLTFPAKAPASLEGDELCQLAIVFVMLEYSVKHMAEMVKSCVRHKNVS